MKQFLSLLERLKKRQRKVRRTKSERSESRNMFSCCLHKRYLIVPGVSFRGPHRYFHYTIISDNNSTSHGCNGVPCQRKFSSQFAT